MEFRAAGSLRTRWPMACAVTALSWACGGGDGAPGTFDGGVSGSAAVAGSGPVGAGGSSAGAAGSAGAGATSAAGAGVAGGLGTSGDAGSGGSLAAGGAAGTGGKPVCNLPAQLPITPNELKAPASEDFTFDREGNLVGIYAGGLWHTKAGGEQTLKVPGLVQGSARGMRFLKHGDLIVVDSTANTLLRVTPDGGANPVLAGLPTPNGVAIGRDGLVYVTHSENEVRRINPDTGAFDVIVDFDTSFDGIVWGLDYETLYVSEELGRIFRVELDAAGKASEPVELVNITEQPGSMGILDGMTIDECGNLYAVQMQGIVWQITQQGKAQIIVEKPGGFMCALNFGSGIGGWKADALYVMDFGGNVSEIPLGFRGRPEPHLE